MTPRLAPSRVLLSWNARCERRPYGDRQIAKSREIELSLRARSLGARRGIATMWRPIVRGAVMTIASPGAPVLKQCACGATYDASSWQDLPLVGVVGDPTYGRESLFEIRQCTCQSSIAIKKTRPTSPTV